MVYLFDFKTFKCYMSNPYRFEGVDVSEEQVSGLVYECVKCHAKVKPEELEMRGGRVKCTYCGYRVLRKIRPPVVRRISSK